MRQAGKLAVVLLLVAFQTSASAGTLEDVIRRLPDQEMVGSVERSYKWFSNSKALKHADLERFSQQGGNTELQLVPIQAFPWQVALVLEGQDSMAAGYFCGGVQIGAQWVLTAAHCVSGANLANLVVIEPNFWIVTGTMSLSKGGFKNQVESVTVHPDWDPTTLQHDIALIKTSQPVIGVAIELPPRGVPMEFREGTIGQVVGWGQTTDEGAFSEDLLLLGTQVISDKNCNGPAGYGGDLFEGMFCARSLVEGNDACLGFGGSPLMLNDEFGQRYVAGLVSWSIGCPPNSDKPGVYTDVLWHLDWITAIAQR